MSFQYTKSTSLVISHHTIEFEAFIEMYERIALKGKTLAKELIEEAKIALDTDPEQSQADLTEASEKLGRANLANQVIEIFTKQDLPKARGMLIELYMEMCSEGDSEQLRRMCANAVFRSMRLDGDRVEFSSSVKSESLDCILLELNETIERTGKRIRNCNLTSKQLAIFNASIRFAEKFSKDDKGSIAKDMLYSSITSPVWAEMQCMYLKRVIASR